MKHLIGIQSFERIIEDGYVYVDKTHLIYNLTHSGSIYFLSRPRRFGKSLLVSTLKNYYPENKTICLVSSDSSVRPVTQRISIQKQNTSPNGNFRTVLS